MWYRTEFDFTVLFIYLRTRKMPFNALVFTLRSKVEFNWIRPIRPVMAQLGKKANILETVPHAEQKKENTFTLRSQRLSAVYIGKLLVISDEQSQGAYWCRIHHNL